MDTKTLERRRGFLCHVTVAVFAREVFSMNKFKILISFIGVVFISLTTQAAQAFDPYLGQYYDPSVLRTCKQNFGPKPKTNKLKLQQWLEACDFEQSLAGSVKDTTGALDQAGENFKHMYKNPISTNK